MLLIFVLPLSFITMQPVHSPTEIQPPLWENPSTQEVINKYATEYGVDPLLLDKIMVCESGRNKDAINKKDPNGGSYGIMQYQKPTWEYFEKKYGQDLDFYSYHDQIKMTAIAVSDGQGSHWSCYRKIKGV